MGLGHAFRVHVTDQDIAAGIRFEPSLCPVARAGERAAGGVPCQTDGEILWFYPEGGDAWANVLRDDVQDFTYRFDHEEGVAPITFEVYPSRELARGIEEKRRRRHGRALEVEGRDAY